MTNVDSFTAGDGLLGYIYQFRYALYLALDRMRENPDHMVSIELLDDIAIQSDNGRTALVQTKHHKEGVVLNDLSPDLWKTIRVWASTVASGEIDPTTSVLVLVTTSKVAIGSAASQLNSETRDPDAALPLLESAIQRSTSQTLAPSFKTFLDLTSDQRRALVRAIYVCDTQPRADALRKCLEHQLRFAAPRGRLHLLTDRLEGWWSNQVIKLLSVEPRKSIPLFTIDRKLDELRDEFSAENLPIDYIGLLPPEDRHDEFMSMMFVKQMRLVGANRQIVDAIKDYYRAFTQRNRWVSDSLLYIDELEEYEKRLKEAWTAQFNWMLDDLGTSAAEAEMQRSGRELLKWVLDVPNCYIKAECTEPYVVRGNLHILADELEVGWHPQFAERLKTIFEEAAV